MKEFEEWFHELEGFALRSEKFYADMQMYKDSINSPKVMVDWLQAAYEQGKQDGQDSTIR